MSLIADCAIDADAGPNHDPDCALIQRIIGRDEAAMAEFHARHVSHVWSVTYRVTRRSCGADEATQDVFLNVWRFAGRYDASRGSTRSWLSTIARYRATDWLRHEIAVHRRELAAVHETPSAVPFDEVFAIREQIFAALAMLPATEREVLVLAHFGGCTYREAATELSIPEGTAKSRIRSALARLSTMIGDGCDAEPGPPAIEPGHLRSGLERSAI